MRQLAIGFIAALCLSQQANACMPEPRNYKPDEIFVYVQLGEVKFAVPERVWSMPSREQYLRINYTPDKPENADLKFKLENHEEITLSTDEGVKKYGVAFRDDVYMNKPNFNSIEAVRQFLSQFVLDEVPSDWKSTFDLMDSLMLDKLEFLAPCAAFSPNIQPFNSETDSAPPISVIQTALKNKNQNVRAVAVRWLSLNPWKLPDIDAQLNGIEQRDESIYVRDEVAIARKRLAK